ncbi:hypothetical protein CP8484711_1863A, partial [Chlamydia psittaci 84-8471/1]
MNITNP